MWEGKTVVLHSRCPVALVRCDTGSSRSGEGLRNVVGSTRVAAENEGIPGRSQMEAGSQTL